MYRWAFALALLLAAPFTDRDAVAADKSQPAFHRGLNIAGWHANAARQPLYERDFMQIKEVGFDHVRLPVNPDYFGFKVAGEGATPTVGARFREVDQAIEWAVKHRLPLILDVHFNDDTTMAVEKKSGGEDALVALWSSLARRYKDYPDDALAFELINEPLYYYANARYRNFVSRMVAAVRAESPSRWIIVGAPRSSSIEALREMEPLDDPRVIYAFHFYEPFMITHQGVRQGFENKMLRFFRGLPYPAALVNGDSRRYAPQAPNRAQADSELEQYRSEGWGYDRLNGLIRSAREWAETHKARVICTEFGANRNQEDAQSRYRWIADARKAFDANNIGWELWDYTDLFGIARLEGKVSQPDPVDGSIRLLDPPNGRRVIDPEAVAALGLTPLAKAQLQPH